MPTCPKGHDSSTDDYCDQCGTPITGGGAAGSGTPPAAATPATAPAETAGQTCPQCGTARAGRFCEVDGYDFVAADLGGGPPPTGDGADASAGGRDGGDSPAGTGGPDGDGGGPGGPAGDGAGSAGSDGEATAAGGGSGDPAGGSGTDGAAAAGGWRVALSADRAYHERVLTLGGPDAAAMTFPPFYPERQFALSGGQLLIGRRSRSRGINPQIDLTGPPEDPGISHSHALLVPGADGGWSVVDLDSANGTYLNGSSDPIAPNAPVELHDGDQVHLGAWTTLTVTAS